MGYKIRVVALKLVYILLLFLPTMVFLDVGAKWIASGNAETMISAILKGYSSTMPTEFSAYGGYIRMIIAYFMVGALFSKKARGSTFSKMVSVLLINFVVCVVSSFLWQIAAIYSTVYPSLKLVESLASLYTSSYFAGLASVTAGSMVTSITLLLYAGTAVISGILGGLTVGRLHLLDRLKPDKVTQCPPNAVETECDGEDVEQPKMLQAEEYSVVFVSPDKEPME